VDPTLASLTLETHISFVTFHARTYRIEHTLRELPEDGHRGDSSENESRQLRKLVAREALNQLRGHIFGLFFVTRDCSREIVTNVVQDRAQELRGNVADEESRSEGKDEHYVAGGSRHHAKSPEFAFTPVAPVHPWPDSWPYSAQLLVLRIAHCN